MSMTYMTGATSKSIRLFICDDTGLAVTGLIAATMPAIYYWIAGANSAVAISLSDLALITSAWSSGGVKEIDSVNLAGYYRLDVPNAAWAGSGQVTIGGEASGKHVIMEAIDNQISPSLLVATTIATLATQKQFTLTSGSPNNNSYLNQTVVITKASDSTQKAVGTISGYVGSTLTVTLAKDPGLFTMAAGDSVYIYATAQGGGQLGPFGLIP